MHNIYWAAVIFCGLLCISGLSHANSKIIEDLGYRALQDGDYKSAIRYISFLATNGNVRAQYNMGVFYRDGVEVQRDQLEALRWFLKAADGGNMLAQYAAGLAFYRGQGSSPDPKTALDYFLKSALKGHASAPLNIGKLFYSGEGVTKNYKRAYFWWKLASERNAGGAEYNLRKLSKIMSEKDKKEAYELIAKCRAIPLKHCLKFLIPQDKR